MRRRRFHILAAAGIALCVVPGCVFTKPRTICRVWADWNTYACWSISAERLEHLPYRRPQVEYILWEYGAGPNGPLPYDDSHGNCNPSAPVAAGEARGLSPTPVDLATPRSAPQEEPSRVQNPNGPDVPRPPQDLPPLPDPGLPATVPPPPLPGPGPTASTTSGIRTISGSEKAPHSPGQEMRQPRGAWLFGPAQRTPLR